MTCGAAFLTATGAHPLVLRLRIAEHRVLPVFVARFTASHKRILRGPATPNPHHRNTSNEVKPCQASLIQ